MKLSIVIPVFNVAQYLPKCLSSVLAQTEHDWECICVDDGSTDGSGNVLSDFASQDSRIKVITQKNAGVSAARNVGLEVAQGEWIHFMDSDDYLAPDYYQRVFMRAAETPRAEVIVTAMTSLYVDGTSRIPNADIGVCVIEGDVLAQVFRTSRMGIAYCMADKVCRRRLLSCNGIRFLTGLHVGEDSLCCQRVLATASCVVLDAANNGYCYWHHLGSLTVSVTFAKLKSKVNTIAENVGTWIRTGKRGALLFAHQAAVECVFAARDRPKEQQEEYVSFLVNHVAFRRDILPILVKEGPLIGRLVGVAMYVLPCTLRLVVLRIVRRIRHG